MEHLWIALSLLGGLAILTGGAELLVRGASRLAAAFGVSPLVIGLTVVAYGTSAPELAVSVRSAWYGQSDLALGNVLGSNICNVLLILGLCALIVPLKVHSQLIRLDVPIMIGTSALLLLLALDGSLGRFDGLVLMSLLIAYSVFAIQKSRRDRPLQKDLDAEKLTALPKEPFGKNVGLALAGLMCLLGGAELFVGGAVELARMAGLSELVIGLTVVAVGTSLPEIATSIVAAVRGERDLAVGNVVGSNIFNILSVLGLSSIVAPLSISPAALSFDIPITIAVAGACLPIFYTRGEINRWEGGLFFGYYIAYTAFLVLDATKHSAVPIYSSIMISFVLPLTAATILILSGRHLLHAKRKHRVRG